MATTNKKQKLDIVVNSYLNGVISTDELLNKAGELLGKTTAKTKSTATKVETKEEKNVTTNTEAIVNKVSKPQRTSDTPIVVIDNFSKKYKGRSAPAVDKVSFNIYPGDFHAFIGANGAGKTTTIKAIIGAYSKTKFGGKITIGGYDNQTVLAKRLVGYIPENANFPKKMNTKNYLISMAMLAGYSSSAAKAKCKEILQNLNMTQFEKKRPSTFSSGQKKKILLAQALLNDPQILVMDEPAANLDPLAREDLFETLLKLQKQGKAIFISSHILDEIDKYATCATILDGGKIVFDGKLDNTINLTNLYKQYVKLGSVDNAFDLNK